MTGSGPFVCTTVHPRLVPSMQLAYHHPVLSARIVPEAARRAFGSTTRGKRRMLKSVSEVKAIVDDSWATLNSSAHQQHHQQLSDSPGTAAISAFVLGHPKKKEWGAGALRQRKWPRPIGAIHSQVHPHGTNAGKLQGYLECTTPAACMHGCSHSQSTQAHIDGSILDIKKLGHQESRAGCAQHVKRSHAHVGGTVNTRQRFRVL